MITFISTYPPHVCGIGTYTKYISDYMGHNQWSVISFKKNGLFEYDESLITRTRPNVDYCLSFPYPSLPPKFKTGLLWLQHAFGMWGNVNDHFIGLIEEGKRRRKKVAVSLHTIHFQSEETISGMREKEEGLLREVLPLVDVLTVFTNGAYGAVLRAFPQYRDKVVVLRHGVHIYPRMSREGARAKFLYYLMHQADIPPFQKEELSGIGRYFYSNDTVLLGNYGFISPDKDPTQLFALGRLLRERLKNHRVITLFAGNIQRRRDKDLDAFLPILEKLRGVHNGKDELFFELFIPENIFPFALSSLDFTVFWCNNATQSGRLAHAQGTGTCVVGRDWEGIGETLNLSGLPAAGSIDAIAERIAELILNPELKQRAFQGSWEYTKQYCFANQARKHLLIERALSTGSELPNPDWEGDEEVMPGEIIQWHYRRSNGRQDGILD